MRSIRVGSEAVLPLVRNSTRTLLSACDYVQHTTEILLMKPSLPQRIRSFSSSLPAVAGLLLTGCASTQMGAQFVDPQTPPRYLRGAAILVVCEGPEPALKLICESQAVGQLTQLGAKPLTDPKLVSLMSGREPTTEYYLPAARAAGALAVFSTTLKPDYWRPSPMSSVSIGIGGWGGSGGYYGGSGVGGGVGVTMPVGGAQGASGLAATGTLVDVVSGRVIWTAGATTSQAGDATSQIAELTRALTAAMRQAGLF
ncbi:MAG: hypothetical protein H6R23_1619 [Proteobacteria bacterium]|jgi:hypothetical protein|nr:hypothetical protein [Pseudomonadota bacterium]